MITIEVKLLVLTPRRRWRRHCPTFRGQLRRPFQNRASMPFPRRSSKKLSRWWTQSGPTGNLSDGAARTPLRTR
jgi:hypothetical protein